MISPEGLRLATLALLSARRNGEPIDILFTDARFAELERILADGSALESGASEMLSANYALLYAAAKGLDFDKISSAGDDFWKEAFGWAEQANYRFADYLADQENLRSELWWAVEGMPVDEEGNWYSGRKKDWANAEFFDPKFVRKVWDQRADLYSTDPDVDMDAQLEAIISFREEIFKKLYMRDNPARYFVTPWHYGIITAILTSTDANLWTNQPGERLSDNLEPTFSLNAAAPNGRGATKLQQAWAKRVKEWAGDYGCEFWQGIATLRGISPDIACQLLHYHNFYRRAKKERDPVKRDTQLAKLREEVNSQRLLCFEVIAERKEVTFKKNCSGFVLDEELRELGIHYLARLSDPGDDG